MIYLDTHAVIWLFAKNLNGFSPQGKKLIDSEELYISPMVELEIEYLFEIDKIKERSSIIIGYLGEKIGLKVSDTAFSLIIDTARKMKWTRNPFDRIITAQASAQDAVLLTKDRIIQKNYGKAFW